MKHLLIILTIAAFTSPLYFTSGDQCIPIDPECPNCFIVIMAPAQSDEAAQMSEAAVEAMKLPPSCSTCHAQ